VFFPGRRRSGTVGTAARPDGAEDSIKPRIGVFYGGQPKIGRATAYAVVPFMIRHDLDGLSGPM
jgi:hypothetical protein